jgi:hypothetical protein
MSGDALRVVAPIVWVAAVCGATWYLVNREPRSSEMHTIVAARDLPQNTYFWGDTLKTEFAGRYVILHDGIKAGDAIKSEYVGDQPVVPMSPPDRILAVVPIPTEAVGSLNASSQVKVCGAESQSVTVVYVRCVEAPAVACSVMVEIPMEAKEVLGLLGKPLRLAESCH